MTQFVLVEGKTFPKTRVVFPTAPDSAGSQNVAGYEQARSAIVSARSAQSLYDICKGRVQVYSLIIAGAYEALFSLQKRNVAVDHAVRLCEQAYNEVSKAGNNAISAQIGQKLSEIDSIGEFVAAQFAEIMKTLDLMVTVGNNATYRLYALEDQKKVKDEATKKPLYEKSALQGMALLSVVAREIFLLDADLTILTKKFNSQAKIVNDRLDFVESLCSQILDADKAFRGNSSVAVREKFSVEKKGFKTELNLLNATIAVLWSNAEKSSAKDALRLFVSNLPPETLNVPATESDPSKAKNFLEVLNIKRGNVLHKLYYGKFADASAFTPDDIQTIAAFSGNKLTDEDVQKMVNGTYGRPPSAVQQSDLPPLRIPAGTDKKVGAMAIIGILDKKEKERQAKEEELEKKSDQLVSSKDDEENEKLKAEIEKLKLEIELKNKEISQTESQIPKSIMDDVKAELEDRPRLDMITTHIPPDGQNNPPATTPNAETPNATTTETKEKPKLSGMTKAAILAGAIGLALILARDDK